MEMIELVNDGKGLGFGIIGGRSTGVLVQTILPGAAAGRVNQPHYTEYINIQINIFSIGAQ